MQNIAIMDLDQYGLALKCSHYPIYVLLPTISITNVYNLSLYKQSHSIIYSAI